MWYYYIYVMCDKLREEEMDMYEECEENSYSKTRRYTPTYEEEDIPEQKTYPHRYRRYMRY